MKLRQKIGSVIDALKHRHLNIGVFHKDEAEKIRDAYHYVAYHYDVQHGQLDWRGIKMGKTAYDLWIYRTLLWKIDMPGAHILECGTYKGGFTLFMRDNTKHALVNTVELSDLLFAEADDRLSNYVSINVIHADALRILQDSSQCSYDMIILDDDHNADHVYEEIKYAVSKVKIGGYLVIEDTNVNGHPVFSAHGPGPFEAMIRARAEGLLDHYEPLQLPSGIYYNSYFKRVV